MTRGPLFIVGSPRSGTTLARALIGAHSRIELANEPELVRGLMSAGVDPTGTVAADARTRVLLETGKVEMSRRHLERLPAERIVRFLSEPSPLSFVEIYEMLLPRPEGDLVWGDKSLGSTFFIPELRSLYPDSVVVSLVRDPRAAVLSRFRKTFEHPAHEPIESTPPAIRFLARTALTWALSAMIVEEPESEVGVDRPHRLIFERLVADPEEELRKVCSLLDLEYETSMLDPVNRRADVTLQEQASAHAMVARAVDQSRAGAASELPGWAAYVVERYAGAVMERHGYPRSGEEAPATDLARVDAELKRIEPSLGEKLERISGRQGGAPERVHAAIEALMAGVARTHGGRAAEKRSVESEAQTALPPGEPAGRRGTVLRRTLRRARNRLTGPGKHRDSPEAR